MATNLGGEDGWKGGFLFAGDSVMKKATVIFSVFVCASWLLTSCGGGGGGEGTGPSVALFADTNYVEYNETDNGAGASNVLKTLDHLGIGAEAFTGISAGAFSRALSGRTVLAFPEITPTFYLAPNLSAQAVSVIHDFVDAGGTLLLFSGEEIDAAIANTVFGWNLDFQTEIYETIYIDAGLTAGTVFEGGPATLTYPNQVTSYDTTGMPSGSMAMYANTDGYSCVSVIPYGSGQVITLGWDWGWADWPYPSTPITEENDGGWFEVLDRAVRY
jgi:hypothetical protein